MSIIFDSHCHPQMAQYDNDREEMLKRAGEAGVSMICVGTDLETSKQGIELSQKHDNMWATVGVHPNDVASSMHHVVWADFEKLLSEPKVVAVGEVGLDYYRTPEIEKQEQQKETFKQFLNLAIKFNKPVIIHSRDAAKGSSGRVHSDMISILATYYPLHATNIRCVAHSFTGTIEDAKKYINLGFYLGFNGILTFARQYDEVVKYVPLEQVLLETDAPFLAPEPFRGKRNEPAHVIEVAKKIANLKNESLEKVIEQTSINCQRLFGLI
jgi:TatD DNase family protein